MKATAAPPYFPYTTHRPLSAVPVESGRSQKVAKGWWPTERNKARERRVLEQQRARVGQLVLVNLREAAE